MHWSRIQFSDMSTFINFFLDSLIKLFDIVHPSAEHLLIGYRHRDRIAIFIFLSVNSIPYASLLSFKSLISSTGSNTGL